MYLPARIILIVSIVVTVMDLVRCFRLKQDISGLTPLFIFGIIFITVLPVAVILWSWHLRQWL